MDGVEGLCFQADYLGEIDPSLAVGHKLILTCMFKHPAVIFLSTTHS